MRGSWPRSYLPERRNVMTNCPHPTARGCEVLAMAARGSLYSSHHQGRTAGVRSASRLSPGREAMGEARREPPFGRPLANGLSRLKLVLHPARGLGPS